MRFEVLGGTHRHTDPKTGKHRDYKTGELISSDIDLAALFVGKFRRVDNVIPDEEPEPEEEKSKEKSKKSTTTGATEARGENVTEDFDKKLVEGFEVFQRGDLYHFYEKGKTAPVNKTGLKRGEVLKAIKTHLEE